MKTITLSPLPHTNATLTGYLHEPNCEVPLFDCRPCIIFCPGGGYRFLSSREADPPAFAFFNQGYHVFILNYSVTIEEDGTIPKHPLSIVPLKELSQAVMLIRQNCEAWHIHPDKIAVCGFSAGGHLAASLGVLWNNPNLTSCLDTHSGMNRPNAVILAYPVISSGEFAHIGSFEKLTGNDPQLEQLFSLEHHVTSDTPPVFLWHTVDDETVPVENSLLFACALRKQNIPLECHLYTHGSHGQSICTSQVNSANPHCATWVPLCTEWLNDQFQFFA